MKYDCLVCAGEFEDEKDSARLTCSDKCRKKYYQFMQELEETNPLKRDEIIKKFLAPINAKFAVKELPQAST